MAAGTSIRITLELGGKRVSPSKLSEEVQDAVADGWFEAADHVIQEIEDAGRPGKTPPVFWPYLTGLSKTSFFIHNETEGREIAWEIHNKAANPVRSRNYYAGYVEARQNPLKKYIKKARKDLIEIVERHVEDVVG